MTYSLARLAPGSYDVLLEGEVVAALVLSAASRTKGTLWFAELLEELPPTNRPAPFTEIEHRFESLAAACEWLGVQRPA